MSIISQFALIFKMQSSTNFLNLFKLCNFRYHLIIPVFSDRKFSINKNKIETFTFFNMYILGNFFVLRFLI